MVRMPKSKSRIQVNVSGKRIFAMGNSISCAPGDSGGCPVKGAAATSATSDGAAPTCPVKGAHDGSTRARGTVYNVYAQPIDPKNQMPTSANQLPAPGQQEPLSVQRVQSTIPKGGTDDTWLYPSPQMFFNALVRKGKSSDVKEQDVAMVVAIHNEMNERAWKQLLQWEELHKGEHLDGEPALRRFMGKPFDNSPKARIKSWFGFGFPFDRHDWFVDRNGKEVRYVIDYYYDPNAQVSAAEVKPAVSQTTGSQHEPRLTRAIHVDVRPAVDDPISLLDRLRRFPERMIESWSRPWFYAEGIDPRRAPMEASALSSQHSSESLSALPPATVDADDAAEEHVWSAVDSRCGPLLERLKATTDEEERRSIHIGLNFCVASVVCPEAANKFQRILDEAAAASASLPESDDREEKAFMDMNACVVKRAGARRERQQRLKAAALSSTASVSTAATIESPVLK